MLTPAEKQTFKELFSKYCRQEMNKGHCTGSECEWCPINKAYDEIFYLFADDEDEEIEDDDDET